MKQSLSMSRAAVIVAALFVVAIPALAQQGESFGPNYDITLQVVVGSGGPAESALPKELGPLSRTLRARFPYANYRLANTFLGRVGENGSLEYKSVDSFKSTDAPMFLDWSIVSFNASSAVGSGSAYHAKSFRFGARVPVRTVGGPAAAVSYESIGLTFNQVGMASDTPTLLGTLTLPQTEGTMFLIVTVKRSEL